MFGWSYPAGCSGPPEDVEYPEECPCGKANYDEDTETWLCPEHRGFCSPTCAEAYTVPDTDPPEIDYDPNDIPEYGEDT